MKRPTFFGLIVALLVIAASAVWAHEKVTLTGYVVDIVCFADHGKDAPEAAIKVAAEHTKDCALMEDCVKGGYGIYADGKWYPFDAKGNELAKTVFDKTGKKDHIKMTVEGIKHEGKIQVQNLTEAN